MQLGRQGFLKQRIFRIRSNHYLTTNRWLGRARIFPLVLALTIPLGACQITPQASQFAETVVPKSAAQASDSTASSASSSASIEANNQGILDDLKSATFVYLGEVHNRAGDRAGQLAILEALYQDNPKLAISMEMFQRPFQPFLDAYLAGEIDEATLVEKTEYEQRWGFPWESYAPILQFAKANQIPVIAANTPTEILRKVAREGLESLSGDDFRYIPPREDIRLDNEAYRDQLRGIFAHHMHGGHGNSDGFERFFSAQVTWDETMAEAIANFHRENPDHRIVSISGLGHVSYGYGIPDRVKRRIPDPQYQHRSVLFAPHNRPASADQGDATDHTWRYEASPSESKRNPKQALPSL